MTRREMIEQTMRAVALPGGAAFFAGWVNAQAVPSQVRFFPPDDFAALEAFTDILIPTDDTPGAKDARCAQFIDFVLAASDEQVQTRWRDAMKALRAAGFHDAGKEKRLNLMLAMAAPEMKPGAQHAAYPAYRLIKQQTTFAFYTARQGMIGSLNYLGNSYHMSFPACTHPEHAKV